MNKIKYILILAISIGCLASCELDDFPAPDAELVGSIVDDVTGELVGQDIIEGGELELREHGYENVGVQYMNYLVDGTFRDSKLFASTYDVIPVKTNFHPIDTIRGLAISGVTNLDLVVSPYIRIKNANISQTGTVVTATFSLEQTGLSNVRNIGLFAGADANTGERVRLVKAEQSINAVTDPSTVYTLSIDINNEQDLDAGMLYYFRIGALYDAPNSKYNYATAQSIQF